MIVIKIAAGGWQLAAGLSSKVECWFWNLFSVLN
jgi:hypothetical protein